jgi:hypothetical protein
LRGGPRPPFERHRYWHEEERGGKLRDVELLKLRADILNEDE